MVFQIIAMGGGGFSMEPDNPLLDQYVLDQSGNARPKVCFLAQAGGENADYIVRFYRAFTRLGAQPSHLSLFNPHSADLRGFLLGQDVIYVGGGNTKSMLALWREWEIDAILREAGENGTVLAGISAGAICWFEWGFTDSIPGAIRPLPCLRFLSGGCTPHFDGEAARRPSLEASLRAGDPIREAVAFDDGAAGHYVNGALVRVVASRPHAKGYRFATTPEGFAETTLETQMLTATGGIDQAP